MEAFISVAASRCTPLVSATTTSINLTLRCRSIGGHRYPAAVRFSAPFYRSHFYSPYIHQGTRDTFMAPKIILEAYFHHSRNSRSKWTDYIYWNGRAEAIIIPHYFIKFDYLLQFLLAHAFKTTFAHYSISYYFTWRFLELWLLQVSTDVPDFIIFSRLLY
jgi:hypothetical protein